MKKSVCVFLMITMLISCVACSGENDSNGEGDSRVASQESVGSTPTLDSQPAGSDVDATQGKEQYVSEMSARYSAHTVNGYSLYSRRDLDSDWERLCVDSKGYISFIFDEKDDPFTNVYNNAFITERTDIENGTGYTVSQLFQASTGNILYTADARESNYIIRLKYSSRDIFEDGYIIVVNKEENYSAVTYQLGILGADGQWVVPMSKDHPILKQMGDQITLEGFEDLYYYGEDVLYFAVEKQHFFYNIKTNQVVAISSDLSEYDTRTVLRCAGPFVNGVCARGYGFNNGVAKVYATGKVVNLPQNFSDKYHEGIGAMYFDVVNDRIIRMGYTYHQDGISVFDSKGAVIKTLPQVDLVEVNGFNDQGLAQLVMKNKDGTLYYTVVDITGTFLFEPIKMETGYMVDVEGMTIDNGENNPPNTCTIVDRTGKVLFQTHDGEYGYRNGIAMHADSQGNHTFTIITQ